MSRSLSGHEIVDHHSSLRQTLLVFCLYLSCNDFYFKACGLIPTRQLPFLTTVNSSISNEDRVKHFLIFRVIHLIYSDPMFFLVVCF